MNEWWNAPKPTVYVPINVYGPDDDAFQTTAPKEMTFEEAEDHNYQLCSMGCTWRWFCWAEMGSA